MTNPLLHLEGLPPFSRIKAEHVEPAVDQLLAENRELLQGLKRQPGPVTWDSLVAPMEEMHDRLARSWSPVAHLNGVLNSDELRKAYTACLPKLSAYYTELGQDGDLYRAYRELADGPEFDGLDAAQRKVIEHALRDFHLAGVDLPAEQKARFREIMEELSKLSSGFQDNVLDATNAWRKTIADAAELEGMPESALQEARQRAQQEQQDGWLLTLDFPCYQAVMAYCDNRELRREMYEAFVTRASELGPDGGRFDNAERMERIMALRHEAARLLGFDNYAERSLAPKMAGSTVEVMTFLLDLAQRARPQAQGEFVALQDFARQHHAHQPLEAWDVAYYSEKLRQHRYDISQEELRPYFPENRVVPGLFRVAERLYGIEIRQRQGVDVWHQDVRFYEVFGSDGQLRAQFYLDLYARPRKRGGAWMDSYASRRRTRDGVQLPVAYLTCNFSGPVGDRPALFTHTEVTTLFHEFGHGLHHMLTRVDYADVAGINGVEWDAVELPSQFLENWCWEREALDLIAAHWQTGEPLPETLYQRMIAARNFQSGMSLVRQLEFSLFDFRLHLDYQPEAGARVQETLGQVRDEVAVVPIPPFNRFPNSFGHIFAGGYAAGYYSYKWAEVLSADAFSKFEERGIFDRSTGEEFLHSVLEVGGSRDAMTNFVEFRGRRPSIEPLLRHSGISAEPA